MAVKHGRKTQSNASKVLKASLGDIVAASNSLKHSEEKPVSIFDKLTETAQVWASEGWKAGKAFMQKRPAQYALAGVGAGVVFLSTVLSRAKK